TFASTSPGPNFGTATSRISAPGAGLGLTTASMVCDMKFNRREILTSTTKTRRHEEIRNLKYRLKTRESHLGHKQTSEDQGGAAHESQIPKSFRIRSSAEGKCAIATSRNAHEQDSPT